MSLSLRHIVFFEEENPGPFSFGRSKKIVLHLSEPAVGKISKATGWNYLKVTCGLNGQFMYSLVDKMPGPTDNSLYNYVKLSFKEGLDSNFITQLSDTIMRRMWEFAPASGLRVPTVHANQENTKPPSRIKPRTGIIGIERSLEEKQKETNQSISVAFQDLRKLMDMAKDMVAISKTISAKIRVRFNDLRKLTG